MMRLSPAEVHARSSPDYRSPLEGRAAVRHSPLPHDHRGPLEVAGVSQSPMPHWNSPLDASSTARQSSSKYHKHVNPLDLHGPSSASAAQPSSKLRGLPRVFGPAGLLYAILGLTGGNILFHIVSLRREGKSPSAAYLLGYAGIDAALAGEHLPNLGALECGPFDIRGLSVKERKGSREYADEVLAGAAANWAEYQKRHGKAFDGPVWCLMSHRQYKDSKGALGLQIEMQRSTYKYVLYTHHSEAGLRLPANERAGACGLLALAETADGYVVVGQRSKKAGALPGYWHSVPSGQVDDLDINGVLQKEVEEELGLDWSRDVTSVHLIGLLDKGVEQGHAFEFTYWLQLRTPAADLEKRFHTAIDKGEHEALVFVKSPRPRPPDAAFAKPPATSEFPRLSLEHFLTSESYQLTSVTRRALLLLQGGCPA